MRAAVTAIAVVVLLGGCAAPTVPRYSISADNTIALREYEGGQVVLVSMRAPADMDLTCRLAGSIHPANGQSIPEFVRNAFNDEFKVAGIYAQNGTQLRGALTNVAFSAWGISDGWWELSIELTSPDGSTLVKSSRTTFSTGYGAVGACINAAQAFGGGVQDLIHALVIDSRFRALIK